jgi:polysaccharide pyruvyl transferase WcaK-like protein
MNFLHVSVLHDTNNNSGDNLLYFLVRQLISRAYNFQIQWILHSQWDLSSAEEINRYNPDVVIFGGGGLFLPDQAGAKNTNKTFWQIDLSSADHKLIKAPFYACSVGFNWFRHSPIPERFVCASAKSFIETSRLFSVRNHGSAVALSRITGLPRDTFYWLPCPTTLIDYVDAFKELLPSSCSNSVDVARVPICAVNLPADRLGQRLLNYSSYSFLLEGLNFLKSSGYRLVYLAHKATDLDVVASFPAGTFDEAIDVSSALIPELLNTYSTFDLVLGGRGHSLMIPVGLSIPIISLTTHDKQKFFMEDLGLSNFSIEIDEYKPSEIAELLKILLPALPFQGPIMIRYKKRAADAWHSFCARIRLGAG